MQYTGNKCLVAGSDGVVHSSIEEAIDYRDTVEQPAWSGADQEK